MKKKWIKRIIYLGKLGVSIKHKAFKGDDRVRKYG